MKTNKIIMLCGGLLLSGALLSCSSDDDSYDFPGYPENMAYLPLSAQTPFQNTITITPAGVIGTIGEYKMGVNFQRTPAVDTRVTFVLDQSLVAEYNMQNGTEYAPLPEDLLTMTKATATVYADTLNSVDSISVAIDNDKLALLTEPQYLAAFRIADIQGDNDMKISTSRSRFYAIINANIQNLHLVANDVQTYKVSITPIGVMGSANFDQPLTLSGNLSTSATVKLVRDNSLLALYNSETGDQAVALPDGLLQTANLTTTIEQGSSQSVSNIQMSVADDQLAALPVGVYVVPFKMTVTRSSDGVTTDDGGHFFLRIPVAESGPVRDGGTEADLLGTALSSDVLAGWTVTASSHMAEGGWTDLVYGNGWAYDREPQASFTVDSGEAGINLTAFYLNGYTLSSYSLAVSDDGTTWTDLPTADNATIGVRDGWYTNYWYALYGAFHCRYLRFTLNIDTNSYYWDYLSWGSWANAYVYPSGIGIRVAE